MAEECLWGDEGWADLFDQPNCLGSRRKIVRTGKDYCFWKTTITSSGKSIVNWLPLTLIVPVSGASVSSSLTSSIVDPLYGIRGGYYFRITKLDTVLKSTTALMRS